MPGSKPPSTQTLGSRDIHLLSCNLTTLNRKRSSSNQPGSHISLKIYKYSPFEQTCWAKISLALPCYIQLA